MYSCHCKQMSPIVWLSWALLVDVLIILLLITTKEYELHNYYIISRTFKEILMFFLFRLFVGFVLKQGKNNCRLIKICNLNKSITMLRISILHGLFLETFITFNSKELSLHLIVVLVKHRTNTRCSNSLLELIKYWF